MELPEDALQGGKIVISADARPSHGHERVYNPQVNLQELSIVTNEKISDLNPTAMPLHFTLFFVHGTHGWDVNLTHVDTNKCVSPRQFFAFHLQTRNTESDYIFQGRRLFQEWILHGAILCESQRLLFQGHNQT